jgi:hypothetical protein
MSFKSVIIKGQWVTGENEYGYPVGERLPLHTPFQKFNWLKVNGLLSSEPPETPVSVETPKPKAKRKAKPKASPKPKKASK